MKALGPIVPVSIVAMAYAPGCGAPAHTPAPLPIIDMHLHATSLADYGGGVPNCADATSIGFPGVDPKEPITFDRVIDCARQLPAPPTDQALMKESLARLDQYNIWAVTSGPLDRVSAWRAAAPDRIIPAISFSARDRTPEELGRLVSDGTVALFAEVGPQYRGLRVDDEKRDIFYNNAARFLRFTDAEIARHHGR